MGLPKANWVFAEGALALAEGLRGNKTLPYLRIETFFFAIR